VSESRDDPLPAEPARPGSRPSAGSDHVSELLFQWETRHLSPARRAAVAWWRRSRQGVVGLTFAILLFALGAAVAAEPGETAPGTRWTPTRSLEEQLTAVQNALDAREGELQLARLELNRLQAIVDHSRHNRIPADLAAAIYDIALTEGVEPSLAFSLVRVESGFTRQAVSSAGAVGFTQVMPSTASWLQPGLSYSDLFERDTNLRLGFRYLRMMLEQYRGDLHLALLAYNRGPGRVDDILRGGGDPSNGYSRLVRAGMLRKPAE
jgi:soluble lytic murein transglycosylase-like protein